MRVSLGDVLFEYSLRNKQDEDISVYSVTNTKGFCKGYFSKDVSSKDKKTYKIVPRGYFAYNPSRINVGSIDYLREQEKVIVSPLYVVFGTKDSIDKQFLLYFLKSEVGLTLIKASSSGSVRDILKFTDLRKFNIELPDIEEQRRRASVLTKIDNLIIKCTEYLRYCDNLVKSRFIELFGSILDVEKVTLSSVCRLITDGTHQAPQFTAVGVPFIFVSNIISNEIDYSAEKFISEEVYKSLIKRTPIEVGDLLLSTVGSYGHPAVVKSSRKFCFQRHIAYIKPDFDKINSCYLHAAILSEPVQRRINERVKGIAQKTLNLSEVKALRIPLPGMEQQKIFEAFSVQVDKSKYYRFKFISLCRKIVNIEEEMLCQTLSF